MWGKFWKVVVALAVCFFAVAPAHAAIYDGGVGGGSSGSGGGGTWNATWEYLGPNLGDLGANGFHPGRLTITPPKQNFMVGMGHQAWAEYIKSVQGECNSPRVKAVFAILVAAPGSRNYQMADSRSAGKYNRDVTYGELADKYTGGDPQVTRQLRAEAGTHVNAPKFVVCVTDDGIRKWEEEPVYERAVNTKEVTCVYSRQVSVKRQISALATDSKGRKRAIDPIGEDNLEDQAGDFQRTFFGDKVDDFYSRSSKPDPDTAYAELQAACDATRTQDRANVNLTDKNKAGMAEGGVLNVIESEKSATYRTSQEYQQFKGCTSYEWVSYDNGRSWAKTGATGACSGNYPDKKDFGAVEATKMIKQTPKISGFWQMISVHCNKQDFYNLMNEVDGETIVKTEDGTDGNYSAVAYSKVYDHVPQKLDFGDTGNPQDTAKYRSGTLGFYDKECGFECEPSGDVPVTDDKPAQEKAGLKTFDKDGYGAASGVDNTNRFEFFRDNEPKTIKVGKWVPKTKNGVNYNNEKAITTTINRWINGTPSVDGSSGGKFTMKQGKQDLFDGKNGQVVEQKNWDTSLINTATSKMLPGEHTEYTVQSNWASETDKPQVFNFKWEYAPNVTTNVNTSNVGFNPHRDRSVNGENADQLSTPIQGKCYARFGSQDSLDTTGMFQQNTGTGTPNNLDGKLVQGEPGETPANDHNNLFVRFVRATGE